jgi:hypothetical protein
LVLPVFTDSQFKKLYISRSSKAISKLTRDLLTLRPEMQIHQYEGIYGVTDENGVSVEVIDFDGLDAFDLSPTMAQYSPGERLASGQLLRTGYLQESDRGTRVAYHQQQSDMRDTLAQLDGLEGISEDVKTMSALRPSEDITAYAKRLSNYGRLARSVGYCGLEWAETDAPNVVQATVNDWSITLVKAGGFETAYIERAGKVIPINDARELYDLTKQVLGSNMLRLYVSLSREGD